VEDFLQRETGAIEQYVNELEEGSPYKTEPLVDPD
jgi:predicted N-acyltransferase